MNILLVLLAYLIGSISGSLFIGKLRGVDIRTLGSGNAGGTNAFRTQGARFALGVALIDVGKGVVVCYLAQTFFPNQMTLAFTALFFAVLGHIWPIWHGFRGGKGAATLVGGLIVLWPQSLIFVAVVWSLCMLLTGYVGLSTVLASVSLLASALYWNADVNHFGFASITAVLITFSHRGNLSRLRAGTEFRFEKARILGRMLFD